MDSDLVREMYVADMFRLAAEYLLKAAQITDQYSKTLSENEIICRNCEISTKKENTHAIETVKERFQMPDKEKEKEIEIERLKSEKKQIVKRGEQRIIEKNNKEKEKEIEIERLKSEKNKIVKRGEQRNIEKNNKEKEKEIEIERLKSEKKKIVERVEQRIIEKNNKEKVTKRLRKKTGYQLYFEQTVIKIKIKKNSEGTDKEYLKIKAPELSSTIYKEWKAMGAIEQKLWNDKAEEITIITQALGELPQKRMRIISLESKSDTGSDNELATKNED